MSKVADKPYQQGIWLWSINPLSVSLWPLSKLFCLLTWIRYQFFQWKLFKSTELAATVLVVGNITVGGNGKTPIVIALFRLLQSKGYKVGILSRGYKSDYEQSINLLTKGETSDKAGDEANMLSELCRCPIAIGADRVSSGQILLKKFPDTEILLSDDGLQHYSMQRDIEFAVRRYAAEGNGFCLPAGPLREPKSRLDRCDLIIDREGEDITENFGKCWNLKDPSQVRSLNEFCQQTIYAVAGIGFPELFFKSLEKLGLDVITQAYADHYIFKESDLSAKADKPLLVTHKDAVKLRKFGLNNIWVVPLDLTLSNKLQSTIVKLVESKING